MDKRLKNKWVKKLRSGEVKQGQFALKDSLGGYCCLGVLCTVLPKRLKSAFDMVEREHVMYLTNASGVVMKGSIPVCLCNEIGLAISEQDRLVEMNDRENRNFGQIADWIEENL